jgi:hypothetical protein
MTGDAYTGDCFDCQWGFEAVTTAVVQENGTEDCEWFAPLTALGNETFSNFYLFFHANVKMDGVDFSNALTMFFDVAGIEKPPFYYYYPWSYDGHPYGSLTQAGQAFTWDWSQAYVSDDDGVERTFDVHVEATRK